MGDSRVSAVNSRHNDFNGLFRTGGNTSVIVRFPDDTFVTARGRLGLVATERIRTPDFAVYLDDRWAEDPEVTWPYQMVPWPDFGLPVNEVEVFDLVRDIHGRASSGELVEIACYGGLGRTGTVLGCLAIVAGVDAGSSVHWIREHYDHRAIETSDQEAFIARFAQSL
jgi:protein-tyrosine phosphatase family protein